MRRFQNFNTILLFIPMEFIKMGIETGSDAAAAAAACGTATLLQLSFVPFDDFSDVSVHIPLLCVTE